MVITFSYGLCAATPWNPKFDYVGKFSMRVRKDPEEITREREVNKSLGLKKKVEPYKTERHSIFTIRGNTCYFMIGSWERLKTELDKLGEAYTVKNLFDAQVCPEPNFSCLEDIELKDGQAETLALLTSEPCGMICSSVGFGKSFIIRQLCKIYPTLNILIVCSSVQVINELYKEINKDLPGQVGLLNATHDNIDGKRIIVTTNKSMEKLHPERVQLTLVDECHSMGYNSSGEALMKFCFGRRFGFSATPIRNQGDYKFMEALFGPILQEYGFQEAAEKGTVTQIDYTMIPLQRKSKFLCDDVEVLQKDGSTFWVNETEVAPTDTLTGERKKKAFPDYLKNRLFYWNNHYRNEAIVDTFFKIKNEVPDAQILIIVQSIEHLIRLHQKLKCCAFIHGERGDLSKYNKMKGLEKVDMSIYKQTDDEADKTKNALAKGTLKWAISTMVLKQGVNLNHLAVLIRADAAVSGIPSIQIPGRLARLDDNKPRAYLIDFSDEFCNDAAGRAIARTKQYRTQGWEPKDLDTIIKELKEVRCTTA